MSMKKALPILILVLFILTCPVSVYAHSGKTDGRGGHTDHSTGEYHYHHGYSAHSHYDMDGDGVVDCPYDFEDKTDHSSVNKNTGLGIVADNSNHSKHTLWDILSLAFEFLPAAISIWLFCSYFLFYIFGLFWGSDQGCSTSMIAGSVISIAAYLWFIIANLSR